MAGISFIPDGLAHAADGWLVEGGRPSLSVAGAPWLGTPCPCISHLLPWTSGHVLLRAKTGVQENKWKHARSLQRVKASEP